MNATRSYQCSHEFHSCQPAIAIPRNGRTVMSPVSVRSSFWFATGWTSSRGTASSAVMRWNLPAFQDPSSFAQDCDLAAVRRDAVDLELVAPDHEVRVRVGFVHPSRVRVLDGPVTERPGDAVAPRDVGRRVLVEERVLEHDAGLAHARRAVDQRDLADAAPAGVDVD